MEVKQSLSEKEYLSIRSELTERIKLLNSQSFTALATIISFWATGLSFKIALLSENIQITGVYEKAYLDFLCSIIFLIPVALFLPLSVKSGENLTQIASISAYIRVFYDYSKNGEFMNWETSNNLLSKANVDRRNKSSYLMKFFNGEYTTLSCTSFFIYLILMVVNSRSIYFQYKNNMINCTFLHFVFLLYFCIMVFTIFLIYFVHKSSSIKYTMMAGTLTYVQGYITRANELGIIKDEDLNDAINELNPLRDFVVRNYYNK